MSQRNAQDDDLAEIEAIRRAIKEAKPVVVTEEGELALGDKNAGTKIKEGTFHSPPSCIAPASEE